jgi:hypothetical protein
MIERLSVLIPVFISLGTFVLITLIPAISKMRRRYHIIGIRPTTTLVPELDISKCLITNDWKKAKRAARYGPVLLRTDRGKDLRKADYEIVPEIRSSRQILYTNVSTISMILDDEPF